jgi:sensor histidine kinase regulating citrate/malate metabolism
MVIISKLIDRHIAAYQNNMIGTHFAEVENMYNQVRGWRHDYRNHIQAMKSHANTGDLNEIIRYLDELDTDLKTVDTVIKTGNKMADAILNSKISLARSKHITVTAEANIAVELKTSQLDLCIIIGNLLDNAIEACLALPEDRRVIRIYMEMKGTQLYMSFTNHAAQKKQKKVGGRFLSAKGAGHGFGLVRIDNIIERHNGYISRNSEDGAFTTEILLPQRGDVIKEKGEAYDDT